MNKLIGLSLALSGLLMSPAAIAQEHVGARPDLLLRQIVEGMPKGDKQEVSVLTATLKPGDKTPFHTHRFPVTVYIMEGTFTLEMEGRQPVVLNAGDSFVEPPNVKMTGYNRGANDNMKVVIVYVSDPDTPFLDMVH